MQLNYLSNYLKLNCYDKMSLMCPKKSHLPSIRELS